MGTVTRTRLLIAAFTVSLCGLGITAGVTLRAQTPPDVRIVIIDNDSPTKPDEPGFTQEGFTLSPEGALVTALNENVAYLNLKDPPRASKAYASWRFTNLEGEYVFYATWGLLKNATTKAAYSNSLNATVSYADQTQAPVGITVNGRTWFPVAKADMQKGTIMDITLKGLVTLESGGQGTFLLADGVLARKETTIPVHACASPKPNCLIGTSECCSNGTWACPNGVTGASGCKKQCTMPPCGMAPPNGCVYVNDSAVDADGCPLRPCGELKCFPIEPGTVTCGNGRMEEKEQCDDGNTLPGDGCSTTCQQEVCFGLCTGAESKITIIDNDNDTADTKFQSTGAEYQELVDYVASPTYLYRDVSNFSQNRVPTDRASWNFKQLKPGLYKLYTSWTYRQPITWVDGKLVSYISKNSVFQVKTATNQFQQLVDQSVKPPFGERWGYLGSIVVKPTEELIVTMTPGTGFAFADAVLAWRQDGPYCGDQVVEQPVEECDDGNLTRGDNCHQCAFEVGSKICKGPKPTCPLGSYAECCPDVTWACYKGYASGCKNAQCGNKIIEGTEQCDDGNRSATDGCGTMCKLCPIPTCAAPPANCTYVQDSAVNANGCPVRPCGELKCGTTVAACSDGIDNDNDGAIDLNDKGCSSATDSNEADGQTDIGISLITVTSNPSIGGGYGVSAIVKNYGPDSATSPIIITFNIPQGTKYDTLNPNARCYEDRGGVSCKIDTLKLGATERININYVLQQEAYALCSNPFIHQVQINSTPQGDPNTSNNVARGEVKASCPTVSTCTDSDGGYVPERKGRATSTTQSDEDNCIDTTKLKERVCENNAVFTKEVTCPNGCADGACKPKTDVSVCVGPTVNEQATGQNKPLTVDVNNSGAWEMLDIYEIISYYRTNAPAPGRFYDVNGSGSFDINDVLAVISYNNCVKNNPPTPDPTTGSITLTSTKIACESEVSNVVLVYQAKGITNGKVRLVTSNGQSLSTLRFDALASSVASSLTAFPNLAAGTAVKVCLGEDDTVCSNVVTVTGTACAAKDTVKLTSVVLTKEGTDDVAKVTYEKNFDTCVHMLSPAGAILHVQNHFCAKSGTITAKLSAGLKVKDGDSVKLCHGNNYGICSLPVTVTQQTTQTETITLKSVVISANGLTADVTYKKNFDTCGHLTSTTYEVLHIQNHFCTSTDATKPDGYVTVTVKLSDGLRVKSGDKVYMCHGNKKGSVCSALVTVTQASSPTAATLNIAVKAIGSTDTAVKNQKNVNLLRFEARASDQDVLVTNIVARAVGGNVVNMHNYTLWFDTDRNGVVDTIAQSGVPAQNALVTLGNIIGGGIVIPRDQSILFEIHADVASSLISDTLQLELATSTANYVGAEAVSNGVDLVGIKTNGACATASCQIIVTTTPSMNYRLVSQGNLFVTLDATPTRSRQLLGGILGETILRVQMRAENEDIDVTDLQIPGSSSVDRYELFISDGSTTPFAMATISGCSTDQVPAGTFCANMENRQLIIKKSEEIDLLVRPRMKSDNVGAISGQEFTASISGLAISDNATGRGAVRARGGTSSNTLLANDGDGIAEGEVFIGTYVPAANADIVGNKNLVVLSKIVSITNANPDADNTNIPTGIAPIGQFKFTAATHANTHNGLNKVAIQSMTFRITSTNVAYENFNVQLYNKADSTMKIPCTLLNETTTGTPAVKNSYIRCLVPTNSPVDMELESGESSTLVMETNVTNAQVSASAASSLQVSLENFADPNTGAGFIPWQDKDASANSPTFQWIEHSDPVVRSTLYKS